MTLTVCDWELQSRYAELLNSDFAFFVHLTVFDRLIYANAQMIYKKRFQSYKVQYKPL